MPPTRSSATPAPDRVLAFLQDELVRLDPTGESLDLEVQVFEHRGSHHAPACIHGNGPPVVVTLRDLCIACACIDVLYDDAFQAARRAVQVANEVSNKLSREHSDPLGLVRDFRACSALFTDLASCEGVPPLSGLVSSVRSALVDGYENLKGRVRSEPVRARLTSRADAALGDAVVLRGAPSLMTIVGYRKPKKPDLADALIAAFWVKMPVPGSFLLLVPSEVGAFLAQAGLKVTSWVARADHSDEVIDTAGALWQPNTGNLMSSFDEALKAAQALAR